MTAMINSSMLCLFHQVSGFFLFNLLLGILVLGGVIIFLYLRLKSAEDDRKALQEQLKDVHEQLHDTRAELDTAQQASEKANQAKSEFLTNMSHEFRIYLNVILGYAQIFGKDRLSRKQRKALDIIHRNSEQLLMIISDVLNLSRIEAQAVELEGTDFNLRRFLWNIVEIARVQTEQKGLSLDTDFSIDLPKRVRGDEKRLRQILLNLLNNGTRFTTKGSVIFRAFPIINDAQLGSHIRFEIEDTGIGIPYQHVKNIFQPFHQASSHKNYIVHEGTKLGLTISQKLARLMESEIHVTSKVGRGTLFWFDLELPEATGEDEVLDTEGSGNMIVGFHGSLRKILIADDRYENRVVLKEMLLPLGFGIVEAVDGFDVLAKAAQHRPDLILMDLTMPILNGFEAIRHVRQMPGLDDVIVIGMSASVLRQIRNESLKAGSNDFLAKPFHFDDLLKCLQHHLKLEWIYEQEEPSKQEEQFIA
ncbi:hypothetical protein CSA56_12725 [candidate division KSB3 bacterium]|uniref:histidine kinase n=1 Tax=candidate division KSB3 bacterium TaxID=2044937 RepID=A0A2G6KBY2_9BACT|nr:MAG: hypothetical protein CSA56_12725 [candidate division KSB3 bacterium]